ncbi:hypothetical protein BCR44DRAFT_1430705 [Catenaria anguillulae PL171]|uniref:Uncharacterized protein n=1 Tax=Catenaria anguillulae PL171 TaxID=765915 RepID=A0A1Y2HRK2_9FUNG|nr:hypothetical protein BCR44DRAFT_1430705 [Catenaria anguillulae PL171]
MEEMPTGVVGSATAGATATLAVGVERVAASSDSLTASVTAAAKSNSGWSRARVTACATTRVAVVAASAWYKV